MPIILGLDPGTTTTGYGIIEVNKDGKTLLESGIIATPPHTPLSERLIEIATDLRQLLDRYRLDLAAVEEIFFAKNVKTAIAVAEVRGLLLFILAESKIPLLEFKPAEIKKAVTGSGAAKKADIQKMMLIEFNQQITPDDAADAVAIALTAAISQKFSK